MGKGKKGEKKGIPPFFPTTQPHLRNSSLKKKTPYPAQYHLIKLLLLSSSSLRPPHLKKRLERQKKFKYLTSVLSSPYSKIIIMTPKLVHLVYF
jgi:hypothetical protein